MDPMILEKEALKLSSFERAQLADVLLHSLDNEVSPDIENAWANESEERYEAYKNGEIEALDGVKVLEDIKKRLSQ